jgi:hypothetical protein
MDPRVVDHRFLLVYRPHDRADGNPNRRRSPGWNARPS